MFFVVLVNEHTTSQQSALVRELIRIQKGSLERASRMIILSDMACGLWINRIALCLESKVPVDMETI
jgi:hypothetical protein